MKDDRIHIGVQEILLAVLAVITLVLAVLMLRPSENEASPYTPSADDASESPGATPTADETEQVRPGSLVAGVNTDGVLVRASGEDCESGAEKMVLAETVPGGETQVVDVEGISAISGVLPVDSENSRIIAADTSCTPVGYSTDDGGASWTQLEELPLFWSILPGETTSLQSPDGTVDVTCTPVAVTGLDREVARVWCEDGQVVGTVDGGSAWAVLGRQAEAKSVAFTSTETGYALVERVGCSGIAVEISTNGGSRWEQTYCVEGAGPWALATARGRVAVVGIEETWTSTDGGETWDRL